MEAVDARHLCVDFGVNHSPEAISQSLNAYPLSDSSAVSIEAFRLHAARPLRLAVCEVMV
jgi:hypothetical protein